MHGGLGATPPFLIKLRRLVDNPETDELIYWNDTGQSFHIRDPNRFAKDLLHQYFKHNNLQSFIRQLNMYGFRKVNRNDSLVPNPTDPDSMEFHNPNFQRDNVDLTKFIQRKQSTFNIHKNTANVNFGLASKENSHFDRMIHELKSNQDFHSHQLKMFRTENNIIIRRLNELQYTTSQQSKIIRTLFQVISAIGGPRVRSLLLRLIPRKLAITTTVDATNRSLEYNVIPNVSTDGSRLAASNPELKKIRPGQSHVPAIGNGPSVGGSSTSNVLKRVTPCLALQSPSCSSRKRPRLDADQFFNPYDNEFNDLLNTAIPSEVPQDIPFPRDESGHYGSPGDHLSDIEPSISSPIEGLTNIEMDPNETSAIESNFTKLPSRSHDVQSPNLNNVYNSPISSRCHDENYEIDESVIGELLSDFEPLRQSEYDAGCMEDVVTKCMMSPSLGQSEQRAMLGSFFNPCPEQQCE